MLDLLASKPQGSLGSFSVLDRKHLPPYTVFSPSLSLKWVLGIKLGSLSLHGKNFASVDRGLSPATDGH